MTKNYLLPCRGLQDLIVSIERLNQTDIEREINKYSKELEGASGLNASYFKVAIVEKFLKGPAELLEKLELEKAESATKHNKTINSIYATIIAIYPGFSVDNICATSNQKVFFTTDVGKRIKSKLDEKSTEVGVKTKKTKIKIPGIYTLKDLDEFKGYAKECLVGQDEPIESVTRSVKLLTAGMTDFRVLMFIGKTGTGKTELAKILGEKYSGNFLKINCGEYSHGSEFTKLIGASPGYVGYTDKSLLKEKSDLSNKWVILFDEIEKAGPKFYDFLLSLFDDGTVNDNNGLELDFSNSIFILTSNIGSKDIKDGKRLGFSDKEITYKESKEELINSIKRHFTPEFLGRINDFIVFNELTDQDLRAITALAISSLLPVKITPDVIDYLLSKHNALDFGARGITKIVMDEIGSLVADQLLNSVVPIEGNYYSVSLAEGSLVVTDVVEYKARTKLKFKEKS